MSDATFLRDQAARCRRLAAMVSNPDVIQTLLSMAEDHERHADALDAEAGTGTGERQG